MASSSAAVHVPQSQAVVANANANATDDGSSSFDPAQRLTWAKHTSSDLWWPALVFSDMAEFNREVADEIHQSKDWKCKRKMMAALMHEYQRKEDQAPRRVVRFLGRPLHDFEQVADETYRDFLQNLQHLLQELVCQPLQFPKNDEQLYLDFHRGMDETSAIITASSPNTTSTLQSWTTRARAAWKRKGEPHPAAPPPPRMGPPESPANQSVAQVSLAEDSFISAATATTPRHAAAEDDSTDAASPIPPLQTSPIPANASWNSVRSKMMFSGWNCWGNATGHYDYQAPGGQVYTEAEVQQIAQEHYGWRAPVTRRPKTPQNNAKEHSFGFLWAHHLKPKGWTWRFAKQHEKKIVANDYIYFKPGITSVEHATLGVDYFFLDYDVLDYCAQHDDYPSSSDESSSVDSSPESVQQQRQDSSSPDAAVAKTPAAGTNNKKKPSKKWSFGYLWSKHLEPNGWTMPKAKRNPLADYYYVKPGKSWESGIEGEDYFASDYAVLDYCAQHSEDYPSSISGDESSSPEQDSSPEASRATPDSSVGDASTKRPLSEDEQSQNTDESYHTPRKQKTIPQDPAKPQGLSGGEGSSSAEEDGKIDIYHWKNLWPQLEKCGWKCMKSRNKLQDWWWVRPDRKPDTEGKDYFASKESVSAYCKDMDENDKTDIDSTLASEQSPRKPPAVQKELVPKPSEGIVDQFRPKRAVVKAAQKKASTSNDKSKSKKDKKTKAQKKSHPKATKKAAQPDPVTENPVVIKPEFNTAPWVVHPLPKINLHDVCYDVGGVSFQNPYYYLPNESSKNYASRFDSLVELQQHCCRQDKDPFVNPKANATEQRLFRRWVNYAFVPGKDHDHCQTRALTAHEATFLLVERGYSVTTQGVWKPPAELASVLKQSEFESLPTLCRALRGVEDLNGTGRRRKPQAVMKEAQKFALKKEQQLIALRLYIAEDWSDQEPEAVESEPDDMSNQDVSDVANACKGSETQSGRKPLAPKNHQSIEITKEALKEKRPNKRTLLSNDASNKKSKPNALSIEVRIDKNKPNNAPWVTNPLPQKGWFTFAQKIGASYNGGTYYLPNESHNHFCVRYPSVDGIIKHLGTHGGYTLEALSEAERGVMERGLAYANVPGKRNEWEMVRKLAISEVVSLLKLLLFSKQAGGSWSPPEKLLLYTAFKEGEPLLKHKYASLEDMCKALRRVPDLEGYREGRRRRGDSTLDHWQMIALRLRIAEDFDCKEESSQNLLSNESGDSEEDADSSDDSMHEDHSSKDTSAINDADDHMESREADGKAEDSSILPEEEEAQAARLNAAQLARDKLLESNCKDKDAWNLLMKLGCRHSGEYRLPEGNERFANLQDLAQHILENSIIDLNPSGKLTRAELETLHQWLKFKNVSVNSSTTPVYEALEFMTSQNISAILKKLDFQCDNGNYHLTMSSENVTLDLEGIVNLVRRTEDMCSIGGRNMLTEIEELTLRLWAADDLFPLVFFDAEDFCSENHDMDESDNCSAEGEGTAAEDRMPMDEFTPQEQETEDQESIPAVEERSVPTDSVTDAQPSTDAGNEKDSTSLVEEVETAPARTLAEEQSLAIDSHKSSESASTIEEDIGPESSATDPQTGEIPTSAAKAEETRASCGSVEKTAETNEVSTQEASSAITENTGASAELTAARASVFHTPLLDDHFPKYRTDETIAMQTDDCAAENERTCAEPVLFPSVFNTPMKDVQEENERTSAEPVLPASVFHTPMNGVQEGLDLMQTKDDSQDMDIEIQAEKVNLAEPLPMLTTAFAPSPLDVCDVKEPSEDQNGNRPSIITEVPCEAIDKGFLETHLSCEKAFPEDTRTAAPGWFTQPPEENESEGDDDTFVNYGTRPRCENVLSPSGSSSRSVSSPTTMDMISYLNVLSVEHAKPGLLSQHSELPPVMTQPNFDNHSADDYQ